MESVNSTTQGTIGDQKPPIRIFVDGEEITTTEQELTANEIIRKFGEKDPNTNYLVEIEGNHKISFQGKGNEEIKLHNNLHFQIVSTGPTPVSFASGPVVFAEGLRAIGYDPQPLPGFPDHLVFNYPVEVGKHAGQTVRLGIVVPVDFPNTPPSGPHVSPHIQPVSGGNGQPHPTGGVHPSPEFEQRAGGQWQYWSRPVQNWGQIKRTVAAYMSHVWRLWETQ